MDYILATKNTLLKKKPVQSSRLSDHDIKQVLEGEKYTVTDYLYTENSHYKVNIKGILGDWYIYDTSGKNSHWDCTWEDTEENETEGEERIRLAPATNIIDTPNKINWSDPEIYIGKFFRTGEVTKGDRNRIPKASSQEEKSILALAKELDKLREYWGSGLIVTSWFRPSIRLGYSVDVNARVKGAYNSQHIYGCAIDVYPINGKLIELQKLCLQCWRGGVGKGLPKGFIHLDSRSGSRCFKAGKPTAVWNY